MTNTATLQQEALAAIEAASSPEALEELRVNWLGKKGRLTSALQELGKMAPEERKAAGQALNIAKQAVTEKLEARKALLEGAALDKKLNEEKADITLPARSRPQGTIHPISHVMEEVIAIFTGMGFQVAYGPDVESDYYNFTALNIPETHPARQMHDTFYLVPNEKGERPVLRTHTSPVQIRAMERLKPPMMVVAPGSTYRSDSDATHTPMFHQIEGLVIGKDIHMGHLKGCLIEFLKLFFNLDDVPLRFRNSFFPFTEPSAEVDIACSRRDGEIRLGEGDDWLEILGSGMIHPSVLKAGGIDPNEWQGFAFGMGIERLAMLKYGMADLRQFYEGDLRWLKHYGFKPLHFPTLFGGLAA